MSVFMVIIGILMVIGGIACVATPVATTFSLMYFFMILLFVTSLVSGRNWFWLVSSAVLFGLSVCFLPFVIRARQVQKWVGKCNKLLLVLGVDAALFLNMMNMIRMHSEGGPGIITTVGVIAGIALVVLGIMKNRGKIK